MLLKQTNHSCSYSVFKHAFNTFICGALFLTTCSAADTVLYTPSMQVTHWTRQASLSQSSRQKNVLPKISRKESIWPSLQFGLCP